MRRAELARAGAGLADGAQKLAVAIEHRDAPDEIGVLDIGVALGDVNIAVLRIGDDVVRVGQRLRRIAAHARLAERQQHLAVGTELDDNAALLILTRELLQLIGRRRPRVGHPDIAVAVDMDAMRPYEHAAAEAPDFLALIVEQVDRVGLGAETARCSPRRAAVGRPYGLAIAINGDAVRAAPRPLLLRQLSPIADDTIGIGAAVDRRDILRRYDIHRDPVDRRRQRPSRTS